MTRADGKVAGLLGRLPDSAKYAALPEWHTYATSPFPPLLASVGVPAVADWDMDGNDTYGNCVVACMAHAINAWDVEVTEANPIPSAAECVAQYEALTGNGPPPGPGLEIGPVLTEWVKTGMFNDTSQITAAAKVSLTIPGMIRQGIACYGGVIIGVNLPESAEEQFNADENWSYVPGSPIVGGHCILLCGYDGIWIQAVTWGAVVNVGPNFLKNYMDAAWVAIPSQFVTAGRGPELDLTQLQADIADLN